MHLAYSRIIEDTLKPMLIDTLHYQITSKMSKSGSKRFRRESIMRRNLQAALGNLSYRAFEKEHVTTVGDYFWFLSRPTERG